MGRNDVANTSGLTVRELADRVWLLQSGLNPIHTALLWPGLPPVVPLGTDHLLAGAYATELPWARWRSTPGMWPAHAPRGAGQGWVRPTELHRQRPSHRRGQVVNVPVPAEGFGLGGFGGKTLREHVAHDPEASAALAELDDMGL
jgi:hypothetical protein